MRVYAAKDIFKREYGLEPEATQIWSTIIASPMLIKIIIGIIIDKKIIK
jgi:hypothetical protein